MVQQACHNVYTVSYMYTTTAVRAVLGVRQKREASHSHAISGRCPIAILSRLGGLSLFPSGISNVNICGVFFAKPLNLCTTADSHLRRRPMDRVLEYRYGNKVMWHMAQACGVGVTIAGLVAVSSSFGPYNNMDRLEQLCGTHSCPDDASAVCCSTRLGLNASGCSNYVAARCGVELPRPVALPCGAVRGCSAVAAEFTGALLLLLGGLTLLGVATAAYLKCCACFARTRSERVKEETPVGRHAASTWRGWMRSTTSGGPATRGSSIATVSPSRAGPVRT